MENKIKQLKDIRVTILDKDYEFDKSKCEFHQKALPDKTGGITLGVYYIDDIEFISSIHSFKENYKTDESLKENVFKNIVENYRKERYFIDNVVKPVYKKDKDGKNILDEDYERIFESWNMTPKEVEEFYQDKIKQILKVLEM